MSDVQWSYECYKMLSILVFNYLTDKCQGKMFHSDGCKFTANSITCIGSEMGREHVLECQLFTSPVFILYQRHLEYISLYRPYAKRCVLIYPTQTWVKWIVYITWKNIPRWATSCNLRVVEVEVSVSYFRFERLYGNKIQGLTSLDSNFCNLHDWFLGRKLVFKRPCPN